MLIANDAQHFLERANAGDVEGLVALYQPDAVLAFPPGLFVNPSAIGAGMPVFGRDTRQQLRLVTAQPFDCGITALHFEPRRS
ncbi:MAG: hypothetical protein QOJ73_5601 [Streptosporangiaceae bacterium]|nr:hypothetical protein [Streptosporangiaceae bacterium]